MSSSAESPHTLLAGDCRAVLPTLPAASVHCCITSPPYWGLRDYGVAPTIWGGDAACAHVWADHVVPAANGIMHEGGMSGRTLAGHSATRKPRRSAYCLHCGAWRGQLGLEPSLGEYVAHMVEVFRAVARVLRPDGTLWLNLGDAFASDKGTCHNPGGGAASLGQGRKAAGAHPLDRGSVASLRADGLKPKDLIGLPWRVAFALQADGWYLRSDIVYEKTNPMPESVKDRPTRSHELLFLLCRQPRYFYDADAVMEPLQPDSLRRYGSGLRSPYAEAGAYGGRHSHGMAASDRLGDFMNAGGRNRRSVWRIATKPYRGAHFAVFPPALVEPCLLAGTSAHGVCAACGAPWARVVERVRETPEATPRRVTVGWRPTCACGCATVVPATVLDPFAGVGTTGVVAGQHGRHFIGIELSAEYRAMAEARLAGEVPHAR